MAPNPPDSDSERVSHHPQVPLRHDFVSVCFALVYSQQRFLDPSSFVDTASKAAERKRVVT